MRRKRAIEFKIFGPFFQEAIHRQIKQIESKENHLISENPIIDSPGIGAIEISSMNSDE